MNVSKKICLRCLTVSSKHKKRTKSGNLYNNREDMRIYCITY
nr:MAG TPA: hypothetical protein [Caudoviricetes sp.]